MKYLVNSAVATQYTEALDQNEAESEYMPGLRADGTIEIEGIAIKSREKLAWQVEYLDDDGNIICSHAFSADDAKEKQFDDGTTLTTWYYYNIGDLEWGVKFSNTLKCTFALRNLSATSKTAGADGAVILYARICD